MKFIYQKIIFLLCFLSSILLLDVSSAQNQSRPRFGFDKWTRIQDSLRTGLKLPNPYLDQPIFLMPPGTQQMLGAWVFQKRQSIRAAAGIRDTLISQPGFRMAPQIDWSHYSPAHTGMELDYRESSRYVPPTVTEYMEYKMGRSRYIPLGTLAAASYLAQTLYDQYGYLLRKREKEKYRGLELSDRQIKLLEIIWNNPGIKATEWYSKFSAKYPESRETFLIIKDAIKALNNKYLVKTRQLNNDRIIYFPAISREELILKLKDELALLDAQENSERFRVLQNLIYKLK